MYNTITLNEAAIDAFLADRPGPVGWRRSRNGSLWRNNAGKRLVVFAHRGRFRWVITDHSGHNPQYAERSYSSEAEATDAVAAEVAR